MSHKLHLCSVALGRIILLDFDETRVGNNMCVCEDAFVGDDESRPRAARGWVCLPWHGVIRALVGGVDLDHR